MAARKNSLPCGTHIDNYIIRETISGGGFSIVYLAEEQNTGQAVVIKEYLPAKLAKRTRDLAVIALAPETESRFQSGRKLFFQEASTLATLRHANVVNVLNFFRANGTVYMVMEHVEGTNLQDYITKRRGKLSERFLLTVFPLLLGALKMIHDRGFLHLDIKPGNIHLRHGGSPLLLDFGAVHLRQVSRREQIGHITTAGFSPIEQYNKNGYVGPWTDMYAIGASMRACIEGASPMDAKKRHEEDAMRPAVTAFKKQYSQELLGAIDWAMELDPELRPQNVDAFLEKLPSLESISDSTPSKLMSILNTNLVGGRE